MQYEKLYNEFKQLFPEDSDKLDKLAIEADAEAEDGMHVMFGMVVVPFVLDLLSRKEDEKLQTAFAFFEKMGKSNDSLISEVLEFSVLEDFVSQDEVVFNKLKTYMQPETKRSCASLEMYFNKVD